MKTLYDVYEILKQESKEIKENYYAETTVLGIPSLVVDIKDLNTKFGKAFGEYKDLTIRFINKSKRTIHTLIISKDRVNLVMYNGISSQDHYKIVGEDYEKLYIKDFEPSNITCWKDLFDIFKV